ncbi:MAG: glycosyl hydrolase [Bacteroidota bacterium]
MNHPKMLFLCGFLMACNLKHPEPIQERGLAALEPPTGETLLFIGQDLQSVADYVENCAECPLPGGVATYVNLEGITTPGFYGGLGFTAEDQPFGQTIDWGGGPLDAYALASQYPKSAIQIGLYMVNQTGQVQAGELDPQIMQLADFFHQFPETPFYLRIGYEFDGNWNQYEPNSYRAAFQHIVELLRSQEVQNVAFVWQSATSPVDDILDGGHEPLDPYYPGDEYVDWVGLSWFLQAHEKPTNGRNNPATQIELAKELIDFARAHGKPVMVCESAPQGYHIGTLYQYHHSPIWDGPAGQGITKVSADEVWSDWFIPYFEFISQHQDAIKAVTYINANWDVQGLWGPPYQQGYWGDSRIEANANVQSQWVTTITEKQWMHGGEHIREILQGM